MAVQRVKNNNNQYVDPYDEEGGDTMIGVPPLPMSESSQVPDMAQAPAPDGILRMGGDPSEMESSGLGNMERPADRPRRVPTGAPIINPNMPRGGAPQATPTRPASPTPVASQTASPTLGANMQTQDPQQVARQPLVLGSRQGSMLGGAETLYGGGFGVGGQEELTPKSILQTLLQMVR